MSVLLGKTFNKRLDKDYQKEGLFKRLNNIENARKNLIRDDENEIIYYTPRSEFDDKDDKYIYIIYIYIYIYIYMKLNNKIDTKPTNVFDYLKSLSQETKDLMDEIEDANDNIDIYKLVFIGSNKKKFNCNTFRIPLNFLSAIYNGEMSLKEAENSQRNLEKKIEELRFDYTAQKKEKEKEKINGVLMQANDLLKYRDKTIDGFKDGTFLSEH